MIKETREPIKRAHTGKKYIRQTHKVTGISEPLTVDVSMTRDNCITKATEEEKEDREKMRVSRYFPISHDNANFGIPC